MTTADVRCDVAVVGGGFAGVTAARELRALGYEVALLEARDRLGGRTWTSSLNGDVIELGGTWIHWHQPYVWSEITRYGIKVREDDWTYDAAIVGSPSKRADPETVFDRLRQLAQKLSEEWGDAIPRPMEFLEYASPAARELDQLSMQEVLDAANLDDDDRDLLGSLLFEIAGRPLEEAGILGFARWLALSGWNVDGWYDTNRYRPIGGTKVIIDHMSETLSGNIHLDAEVSSIIHHDKGASLELKDGRTVSAKFVVLAVPLNTVHQIAFDPPLSKELSNAANAGWGKPTQDKVFAHVRGKIGRVFGHLPPSTPMSFFWTFRDMDNDEQVIMSINASSALDVRDKEAVARVLMEQIPGIEEVLDVETHSWSYDPLSHGGNSGSSSPGVVTRHLPVLQRRHGRLAFATADIADGWFGYIDGAIESGMRAARHVREVFEGGER